MTIQNLAYILLPKIDAKATLVQHGENYQQLIVREKRNQIIGRRKKKESRNDLI